LWKHHGKTFFSSIISGPTVNQKLILRGPVVGIAILTFRGCPEKAWDFWEQLARDDGLRQTDPRKVLLMFLHKSIISITSQNNSRKNLVSQMDFARAVQLAWNAYLEDRSIAHIRLSKKPSKTLQLNGVNWEQIKQEDVVALDKSLN